MRERAKPTLRTMPSTTTNLPSRRRSSAELDDCITANSGSRHIPVSALARLLFDREPLDGAAAGLELRPDSGVARRQQRRRGRAGGSVAGIGDDKVGDRPAPAIGSAGQLDEVRVPTEQSLAQEIARGIRDFWRAAFGVGRVQPAKPHDSAVAQLDIEALIDADRLNAPGRPPASRKAGGGENDGRKRGASAAEPRPASANDARPRCAKRKFMLRACRAWACFVHRGFCRRALIGVPVAQLDRAQVS